MENHSYLTSFSIIHRFSILYHIKELKKFKISGHQMGYIMCVCKQPGISQEDLSSYLRLNKGAVAKGIRPLIEEGYIQRIQSKRDRRAYELYPTEKARELRIAAERTMKSFDHILTQNMSGEEQKLFKDLVTVACNNVLEAAGEDRHELTQPGPPPGCRPPRDHSRRPPAGPDKRSR